MLLSSTHASVLTLCPWYMLLEDVNPDLYDVRGVALALKHKYLNEEAVIFIVTQICAVPVGDHPVE